MARSLRIFLPQLPEKEQTAQSNERQHDWQHQANATLSATTCRFNRLKLRCIDRWSFWLCFLGAFQGVIDEAHGKNLDYSFQLADGASDHPVIDLLPLL